MFGGLIGVNLVLTDIRRIYKTIDIAIKGYMITEIIRIYTIYNKIGKTLIK